MEKWTRNPDPSPGGPLVITNGAQEALWLLSRILPAHPAHPAPVTRPDSFARAVQ